MTDAVLTALGRHATDAPDAPAVLAGDFVVTYRVLAETVARTAAFVAGQGVEPGMTVGIGTPDALLHAVMILGCEARGAATLSFGEHDIRDSADGLVHCNVVWSAWSGLSHPHTASLDDGTIGAITLTPLPCGWKNMLDAVTSPPRARLLYSSGTTTVPKLGVPKLGVPKLGVPKVIVLGSTAMDAIVRARCDLIDRFGPEAALFLCPYGPVNDRAMTLVRAMLFKGRTIAFDFPTTPVTMGGAEPSWFTLALPNHVRLVADAFLASAMRRKAVFVDINGAAVEPRTHDLALRLLADKVVVTYGAKEATGITWVDRDGVGTLCQGAEVRIDPDPGLPATDPRAGRIAVRAATMADGYLGASVLSAASFADGWFHTGDVGFQPAPDRLVVLGRADDVLNVGGEKLTPGPLEAELRAGCDINAAVLVTTPDADGIERLCVLIERDDPAFDAVTKARTAAIVGPHAEVFRILFYDAFPRNEAGKIHRNALRAAVADAGQTG